MCELCGRYEKLVLPTEWRIKNEKLHAPRENSAYYAKPEVICQKNDRDPSTAPTYTDKLSRHRLSYLNGGGGSGKTTRAIELFRARKPLMLVPTQRLAKGMRGRGVESQTYHSFFRYCGGRMVRATEVDLVKLQQTKKYEGKTITVFKAENDWKPGVEVLVAIGGTAGDLVFVARKEGGPLHRR